MRAEIVTDGGEVYDVKLNVTTVWTESGVTLRVVNPAAPGETLRILLTAAEVRDMHDAALRVGEFVEVEEIEDTPGAVVGLAVRPAGG
jgi:acyl dehydratase